MFKDFSAQRLHAVLSSGSGTCFAAWRGHCASHLLDILVAPFDVDHLRELLQVVRLVAALFGDVVCSFFAVTTFGINVCQFFMRSCPLRVLWCRPLQQAHGVREFLPKALPHDTAFDFKFFHGGVLVHSLLDFHASFLWVASRWWPSALSSFLASIVEASCR